MSLAKILREHKDGLTFEQIIDIVLPLTGALAQIHGRGMLYLDLKPQNVMIGRTSKHLDDDRVWLIDFGFGRWGPGRDPGSGTLHYWAPEQAESKRLTKVTDIYNFGALLYHMVTGRFQFPYDYDPDRAEDPPDPTGFFRKIMEDKPQPPSKIKSTLPPTLDRFFEKVLAKKPGDRFQSVELMFEALMECVPDRMKRRVSEIPRGPKLPPILDLTAADGATIAYTILKPDQESRGHLVFLPPWVSNQAFLWVHSGFRNFCEELARDFTVIIYDKRGCGRSRSRRLVTNYSFEAQVSDLELLIERLGIHRFGIFAMSAGGPVAISFAARYPEKVSQLILYGTYADGREILEDENAKKIEIDLVRNYWGRGEAAAFFSKKFVPDGPGSTQEWLTNYQVKSASDEHAALFLSQVYEIDVSQDAAKVKCPTLILHRIDDKAIPYRMAAQLRKLIPHATFSSLQGSSHIAWVGDSRDVLDATEEFLRQAQGATGLRPHNLDNLV